MKQSVSLTVWKFPLALVDRQTLSMPRSALPLHVAMQFEQPCLWALVDPDAPVEQRTFLMFGTGHRDVIGQYLGTFQLQRGQLVFHVFEDHLPRVMSREPDGR